MDDTTFLLFLYFATRFERCGALMLLRRLPPDDRVAVALRRDIEDKMRGEVASPTFFLGMYNIVYTNCILAHEPPKTTFAVFTRALDNLLRPWRARYRSAWCDVFEEAAQAAQAAPVAPVPAPPQASGVSKHRRHATPLPYVYGTMSFLSGPDAQHFFATCRGAHGNLRRVERGNVRLAHERMRFWNIVASVAAPFMFANERWDQLRVAGCMRQGCAGALNLCGLTPPMLLGGAAHADGAKPRKRRRIGERAHHLDIAPERDLPSWQDITWQDLVSAATHICRT